MNKEQLYAEVIDWAGNRIDYLFEQSNSAFTKKKKIIHYKNAQAVEEEFFDWFADRNSNGKSNVLFIPYHKRRR